MSLSSISLVDVLALAVVLGSAAYATWKGFISETLSIVAWAAAALASLYFGPWASDQLHGRITPDWLAELAGYAIIFVVVLVPLSFASGRLADGVRSSPVGALDRVFGTGFGIVRGIAILGIAYLVFTAFVPIPSQPKWLTSARSLPLIQSSSEVLLALIPTRHEDEAPLTRKAQTQAEPQAKPAPQATAAVPPKPSKRAKKGYGVGERRALDRLFEATGNGGSGKP